MRKLQRNYLYFHIDGKIDTVVGDLTNILTSCAIKTMSLHEMGPQLKLPIKVTKGSMPLLIHMFHKFLPFEVSEHM